MPFKRPVLTLFAFLVLSAARAATDDSTRFRVPEISYAALDSIVRVNEVTALYYWPSWCSACKLHLPEITALFKSRPDITFLSINDPFSRPLLPVRFMNPPGAVQGWYRIEHHGREKLIAINDKSQSTYFNRHYSQDTTRVRPERIQYLIIKNRKGDVLYHNTYHLEVDSIRALLTRL